MQSGYTQLDAEEREAVRTTGTMSGHLLASATRLTMQALGHVLKRQPKRQPASDIELTTAQQKTADVIAVTTERYGQRQEDGGLAFEAERYRFSVTADGIYTAYDKDLNWNVFQFQGSRERSQEKAVEVVSDLAQQGTYTPAAATAAIRGAINEFVGSTPVPDMQAAIVSESPVTAAPEIGRTIDESIAEPMPTSAFIGAEPVTEREQVEEPERGLPQPLPDNNQDIAAFFAQLVESDGQEIEPAAVPDEEVTAPQTLEPAEEPTQDEAKVPPAEPAAIADDLVKSYGEAVNPSPPRHYSGEGYTVDQQGSFYDVRDQNDNTLLSFEKTGNRYRIIEDHLTDEQRQLFTTVHSRTQQKPLEEIMADPTGNTQLAYLEDLAPAGSKAISFAHHQLDSVGTDQLETQSQGITRHEDQSLLIYSKPDNRVLASATATGQITSQMTPQEAQGFAQAWHNTVQYQQTQRAQPAPSVDMER
ncbi:MAG: hypothetical protein AAFR99_22135 [Cyanobacteria bacterium J06629_9]